jgi:hypothetical protein
VDTIDDFLTLLRDELGLAVTDEEAGLSLDRVVGWDSVHLLSILSILELRTGRTVPLADMLEAGSLIEIYELAVGR